MIPPVLAPTVQLNVLGDEEVSEIFGLVPLHVLTAAGEVTTGDGFTVTVIV
jgi:hypothetical protein